MNKNIANYAWLQLISEVYNRGEEASPRGLLTREILGKQTVIDMRWPVVCASQRKLGYRFMCAEAAWILSGDNRVATIKPYAKEIELFSDDGIFYYGAYGPQFRDQVRHVVQCLVEDLDSRQAVVTLWRPNPPKTKDVPCTVSLHWMVRDGMLNCHAHMRSSDAWLGVPYDWFNFTMLTGYVGLLYRQRTGKQLELGTMYFTADSQHLYEKNFLIVSNLNLSARVFTPPIFDHNDFGGITDLVEHLWAIATKQPLRFSFLSQEIGGPRET